MRQLALALAVLMLLVMLALWQRREAPDAVPEDSRGRALWREEAISACLARWPAAEQPGVRPGPVIAGEGACGIDRPLLVRHLQLPVGGGARQTLHLLPEAAHPLSCPMVEATLAWLAEAVQPAARHHFGRPVVAMETLGTYACRRLRTEDGDGASLSEHAFANAIDVAAFRLAGGRLLPIATGWQGDAASRAFWRDVRDGACRYFSTVLSPDYNALHRDHMHLDRARRAFGQPVCQ